MKGVTFVNYHSFDDWGLILSEKDIGSPAPKVKQVDIEGGDGVLDYTEFFGDVKFDNRHLSFRFSKGNLSSSAFLHMYEAVHNAIHGRKLSVKIDDDSGYYVGRVTVSEWKLNKGIGELIIDVDAEPWKYKTDETVVSRTVNGSAIVNLANGRKRAVPTITADAEMNYTFNGDSFSAAAGTYKIPAFELTEGNNEVTVSGNGTVTFRYQEGGF